MAPTQPPHPAHDSERLSFWLTLAALFVGAALLLVGGYFGDVTSQTAGGSVIAGVVLVVTYKARKPKDP